MDGLGDSIIDWIDFVYSYFSSDYDLETKHGDLNNFIYVKSLKSDVDIEFVVDKSNILTSLEVGSMTQEVYCKCIFNSKKSYNVEFIQDSWFGVNGEEYTLSFTEQNRCNVSSFLNLVLQHGWKEEQFFYKREVYKAIINFEISNAVYNYVIILETIGEQDIPLPFDKLFRKLSVKYIEFRKKEISSKVFQIGH